MIKPTIIVLISIFSYGLLAEKLMIPGAGCKAQTMDHALVWAENGVTNTSDEAAEIFCPITLPIEKSKDDENFFKVIVGVAQFKGDGIFACALYDGDVAHHIQKIKMTESDSGSFDFYVPIKRSSSSQRIGFGCSLPSGSRLFSITSNLLIGYSVGGSVSAMNEIRGMELQLGEESLHVANNGRFTFKKPLLPGEEFEFEISRNPVHQDCELSGESTEILSVENRNLDLVCTDKESSELYSLEKLHHLRLTITKAEWDALLLDTLRSNYSIRTASGDAWEGNSWTHSEVYRQADFEYLDENGKVLSFVEKVAFKMIGNTSRQIPIDVRDRDAGTGPIKPMRFSFSIKFDEEFEDDESVYGCIDDEGELARVDNNACNNILAQAIPEYKATDGREFNGIEKIRLRYNRDDPSYQREVLAHEIMYQSGVPTARATHAAVEFLIVGEDDETLYGKSLPQTYNMGVFVMVEMIDKPFLKSYFDKNGYLFKVGAPGNLSGSSVVDTACIPYEESEEFFDENFCVIGVEKPDPVSREEWLGTDNYLDPEFVNSFINWEGESGNQSQFLPYKPTYDLKTKKKSLSKARTALAEFATFVQSEPSLAELGEKFDIPGFIKAQAAEIVLGAVDHYVRVANNYYLYFNEPSGKWIYMPTDFDYTLIDTPSPDCTIIPQPAGCQTGFLDFKTFQDVASTTAFPYEGKPDWASRPFYSNGPPILWDQIFASKENKARLYNEISRILENHFNWDEELGATLAQRRDRIAKVIMSTDAGIPGDDCAQVYNSEEIDGEQTGFCDPNRLSIRNFLKLRVETLIEEINAVQ
ncbi:MAG: CotH kinase family protein [Halieaceae bacterium]|nr:CotH kinase family protein [Halieaceae bacterium]